VTVRRRRFGSMKFSPGIEPALRAMIHDVDDGACGIATIWREVGYRARNRKLLQPSYESVRRLVHGQRRRRNASYSRLKRAAILAWELVFQARKPSFVVLDLITGADIDRRLQLYQRRARDELPRTRTRAAA
jgi:hypothetical protein